MLSSLPSLPALLSALAHSILLLPLLVLCFKKKKGSYVVTPVPTPGDGASPAQTPADTPSKNVTSEKKTSKETSKEKADSKMEKKEEKKSEKEKSVKSTKSGKKKEEKKDEKWDFGRDQGKATGGVKKDGKDKKEDKKKDDKKDKSDKDKKGDKDKKDEKKKEEEKKEAKKEKKEDKAAPAAKKDEKKTEEKKDEKKQEEKKEEKKEEEKKEEPKKDDKKEEKKEEEKKDEKDKEKSEAEKKEDEKKDGDKKEKEKSEAEKKDDDKKEEDKKDEKDDEKDDKKDGDKKEEVKGDGKEAVVDGMKISPADLKWGADAGDQKINITNTTTGRLAIKIKCSDNNLYRVNPVLCFVEGGKSADIAVSRIAAPAKMDKLVVVCTPAKAADSDAAALFKTVGPAAKTITIPFLVLEDKKEEKKDEKEASIEGMKLSPSEMKWGAEAGDQNIKISNTSTGRLAIKIKCSDNNLYRVNPVMCFVEAGKSTEVNIARIAAPAKADKLIVMCTAAQDADTDPATLFKAAADAKSITVPFVAK